MNNKYKIVGDHVEIYINCKGKKYTVLIDLIDLPKVQEYKRWYGNMGKYGIIYVKDTATSTQLHRMLMDNPKGMLVDHKSGDTLDNRRSNLREATALENGRNINKSTAKSGLVGVHWNERGQYWVAQVAKIHLGCFKDKYEAGRAVNRYKLANWGSITVHRKPIKIEMEG